MLSRGEANTRPRDFYDLYMLGERADYDVALLRQAVANTFRNRHSEQMLAKWKDVLSAVGKSDAMHRQWERYRASASYAQSIAFNSSLDAVRKFFEILETKADAKAVGKVMSGTVKVAARGKLTVANDKPAKKGRLARVRPEYR